MRAALRLIWALGVRHLIGYRLRLALSAFGVASGVALAISVSSFDSSIKNSLQVVASATAREANIEVRGLASVGVEESLASDIRALDDVAAAAPAIESFTQFRNGDRIERVLLLGVDESTLELAPGAVDPDRIAIPDPLDAIGEALDDPLGANAIFESDGFEGVRALFEAQDDAQTPGQLGLFMPAEVADKLGLQEGDTVEVATPLGFRTAPIGGIIPSAESGGARAVVGFLGELQRLLGRPGSVDVIYVKAADPSVGAGDIQDAIGTAGRAGPAAFREAEVRRILASATLLLQLSGVVALFVGGFLVYNTMSMAAVERTTEAALLRAVGGTRRQVFTLFCAEGGLLGVIGAAVGVSGGTVLARAVFTTSASSLRDLSPVDISRFAVAPADLALAAILGIVAAVVASVLPARSVASAEPASALGPSGTLETAEGLSSRPWVVVVGSTLLVSGIIAQVYLVLTGGLTYVLYGLSVSMAGVALLVRPGIPFVARILLRPFSTDRSRAPGLVRLASGEVLRSPGRTAFTVGAVLLALTIVVGVTLGTTSFSRTFEAAFKDILAADLYVRAGTWRPFGADIPLDAKITGEIEAIPGVQFASPFKSTQGSLDGIPVILLAYDTRKNASFRSLNPQLRAEYQEDADLLSVPGRVIVSPSVLQQLRLDIGDTVTLPAPAGMTELEIVGTIYDPSAATPTLYFDFAEFRRLWGADLADSFGVAVEPGADPAQVKRAIEDELAPRFGLAVDSQEEYQRRVNEIVGSFTSLVSSLLLVVVVTAGLGLANTLVISTLERRRDLGVLRAIGMKRGQLRAMVAIESLLVGAIGVGFSWVMGTGLGYLFAFGTQQQLGLSINFTLTPWPYLQGLLLGVGGAVLAALYPAHHASRIDVVEALQYE